MFVDVSRPRFWLAHAAGWVKPIAGVYSGSLNRCLSSPPQVGQSIVAAARAIMSEEPRAMASYVVGDTAFRFGGVVAPEVTRPTGRDRLELNSASERPGWPDEPHHVGNCRR